MNSMGPNYHYPHLPHILITKTRKQKGHSFNVKYSCDLFHIMMATRGKVRTVSVARTVHSNFNYHSCVECLQQYL